MPAVQGSIIGTDRSENQGAPLSVPLGHATAGAVCIVQRPGEAHTILGLHPVDGLTVRPNEEQRCVVGTLTVQLSVCTVSDAKRTQGVAESHEAGHVAPRSSVCVAASSLLAVAFRLGPLSQQTSAWDVAPDADLSLRKTGSRIDVIDHAVEVCLVLLALYQ